MDLKSHLNVPLLAVTLVLALGAQFSITFELLLTTQFIHFGSHFICFLVITGSACSTKSSAADIISVYFN